MSLLEDLAREHLRIVADADMSGAARNVSSEYINLRSNDEPLEARKLGPLGLQATIRWLHRAFTDMRFDVHAIAFNQNVAALQVTLHARQHGPFVVHDSPDGQVTDVFPSNGRSFSAKQTHWITVNGGVVVKHDAVRDDLAMAKQLGWLPPTLPFICRMLLARYIERRMFHSAATRKSTNLVGLIAGTFVSLLFPTNNIHHLVRLNCTTRTQPTVRTAMPGSEACASVRLRNPANLPSADSLLTVSHRANTFLRGPGA